MLYKSQKRLLSDVFCVLRLVEDPKSQAVNPRLELTDQSLKGFEITSLGPMQQIDIGRFFHMWHLG
jgi:hypothetical protein